VFSDLNTKMGFVSFGGVNSSPTWNPYPIALIGLASGESQTFRYSVPFLIGVHSY